MKTLLTYRTNQYFHDHQNDYFLYDTGFNLKVGKLKPLTNKEPYYWFVSPAFHLKANTTTCVSLKDAAGTLVTHVDNNLVKGKLGEFGVLNTPFLYVYWTHTPLVDPVTLKQLGMPVALPHYRELKLVTMPVLNLN